MSKLSLIILFILLSFIFPNCASGKIYKYNVNEETAEDKLILITPLFLETLGINNIDLPKRIQTYFFIPFYNFNSETTSNRARHIARRILDSTT